MVKRMLQQKWESTGRICKPLEHANPTKRHDNIYRKTRGRNVHRLCVDTKRRSNPNLKPCDMDRMPDQVRPQANHHQTNHHKRYVHQNPTTQNQNRATIARTIPYTAQTGPRSRPSKTTKLGVITFRRTVPIPSTNTHECSFKGTRQYALQGKTHNDRRDQRPAGHRETAIPRSFPTSTRDRQKPS